MTQEAWRDTAAKEGWDPNWLGSGGYLFCHGDKPMRIFIIRNRQTKQVVGRFAGPNTWFERRMVENYRRNRIKFVGDVDEVVECELKEIVP